MSSLSLVQVTASGDRTVAQLTPDRFDEWNADAVGQQLLHVAEEVVPYALALDLGTLAYLSSAALTGFVKLHRKVKARGGRLSLFNVQPHVHEVFSVTGLTQVLDVRQALD